MSHKDTPAAGKYRVLVDDHFHYMDSDARWTAGEFDTAAEAIAKCEEMVDQGSRFVVAHPGMQRRSRFRVGLCQRAMGRDLQLGTGTRLTCSVSADSSVPPFRTTSARLPLLRALPRPFLGRKRPNRFSYGPRRLRGLFGHAPPI